MNNKKYDLKKVSKVAVATLFLLFLLVDFLAWPQELLQLLCLRSQFC